MNEITRKWSMTGLLNELSDIQKDECASILEDLSKILIANAPRYEDASRPDYENYCGYILRMVRRTYEVIYPQEFPDVSLFMTDFTEFYNKNKTLFDDIGEDACELYEDEFIKKFMRLKMVEEK